MQLCLSKSSSFSHFSFGYNLLLFLEFACYEGWNLNLPLFVAHILRLRGDSQIHKEHIFIMFGEIKIMEERKPKSFMQIQSVDSRRQRLFCVVAHT